jgi:hypothetical protein
MELILTWFGLVYGNGRIEQNDELTKLRAKKTIKKLKKSYFFYKIHSPISQVDILVDKYLIFAYTIMYIGYISYVGLPSKLSIHN